MPAAEFGLAVRQLTQTVAQSSVRQAGETALALPPGLSRDVYVADIVPPESTRLLRVD